MKIDSIFFLEPRKKLKTEMLLDAIDNEEDSDDSDVDFGGLEDSDEDEEEAEGSDEAEEVVYNNVC